MTHNTLANNPHIEKAGDLTAVFNARFSPQTNKFVHQRTLDPAADFEGLAIRLWKTLGSGAFFNISSGMKRVTTLLDQVIADKGAQGLAAAQVKQDMNTFSAHCDNINLRIIDTDSYHDIVYAFHEDGSEGDEAAARVMTCYTGAVTKFLPVAHAIPEYVFDKDVKTFRPDKEENIYTLSLGDVWKQACVNAYDVPPVIHAAGQDVESSAPRLLLVGDRFRFSDFRAERKSLFPSFGLFRR